MPLPAASTTRAAPSSCSRSRVASAAAARPVAPTPARSITAPPSSTTRPPARRRAAGPGADRARHARRPSAPGRGPACPQPTRHSSASLATVDVRTQRRVTHIVEDGAQWALSFDDGATAEGFDAVIVTAPAPQAADLLADVSPQLAEDAERVAFAPCWSAMFAWTLGSVSPRTVLTPGNGISVACRGGRQARSAPVERWVVQGGVCAESRPRRHDEPDIVAELLLGRFAEAIRRTDLPAPRVQRRATAGSTPSPSCRCLPGNSPTDR